MINSYQCIIILCCFTMSIITNNAFASEHLKKQYNNNNKELMKLNKKFDQLERRKIPFQEPNKKTISPQDLKKLMENNLDEQDEIAYKNASLVNKMINAQVNF